MKMHGQNHIKFVGTTFTLVISTVDLEIQFLFCCYCKKKNPTT